MLHKCNHENIIKLDMGFHDNHYYYISMPRIPGKDLFDMAQEMDLTVETIRRISVGITSALCHLFDLGVVHRDIKPENIMIQDNYQPILIDFGLAAMTDSMPAIGGTMHYMSPEVLKSNNISCGVDCWSFGVTLFAITCGQFPWDGHTTETLLYEIEQFPDAVINSKRLAKMDGSLYDFVLSLLQPSTSNRLGWMNTHDLKQHAFLK
jgi:serine/threonine protein kinase